MMNLYYCLYVNLLLIVKAKVDPRFKASTLHLLFKPKHMRQLRTIDIHEMPYWSMRVLIMLIYYILGHNSSIVMQNIAKSMILSILPYANDTFSHSYMLRLLKKINKVLTIS